MCLNFRDQDIVVSFDSLVAIVEPNEYDKGDNPVMLLAKSWPENLNLTPTWGNQSPHSGQVNDFIFNLESIRYLRFCHYRRDLDWLTMYNVGRHDPAHDRTLRTFRDFPTPLL